MYNIQISVIIAAYNVEKYIDRCVKSLRNQTYRNIEIIVVNDCSTDKTLEICRNHQKNDERIIIVNKEQNEGLSEARNSGIEIASGDYVTFVDGDDFIELDTIEKCVKYIGNSEVDELVFASCFDRKDGSSYNMEINASKNTYINKEVIEKYYKEALGALPYEKNDRAIGITPWARLYKRGIIVENNIRFISERELIYEDLMFFLTVTPFINSVTIVNEPLYHYCENEGSLTQRCDLERFYKVKKMFDFIKENYHNEIFCDQETLLRFQRLMISYIRLSIMQIGQEKKNVALVKDICKDVFTKEVICGYPNYKLPIKQRIFNVLVKYEQAYLLHLLCSKYIR